MGPYTVGADSASASIELHTTRFLKSGDGRTDGRDGTDGDAIREREKRTSSSSKLKAFQESPIPQD